jgi:hypothetical protein
MSDRLVKPRSSSSQVAASRTEVADRDPVKEYLERVAKYVPAEIIAAYLTLLPIVAGTTDEDTTMRTRLYFIILVGSVVLTPLYFRFMANATQPKRLQMLVSTIAFVIWAYSLGGWFADQDIYHEGVAAILLVFFTLISGLVAPKSEEPPSN